jgi:uncharacterized protein YecE (DUF72 family)
MARERLALADDVVPPLTNAEPIRVGTSGWIYLHWRGVFYPKDLPASRWLTFLSSRMTSVEINGTFYSLTTPRACERWRAQVPAGFLFAVKGSRYITHMKKLRDVRAAMANFFASGILRLGSQLGPILWQIPPVLRFDPEVAERFLALLPRDMRAAERLARRHDQRVTGRAALTAPDGRDRRLVYAVEARHESWMSEEAARLLSRWDDALVWADTGGKHPDTAVQTSRTLAYVRLHGPRRIYEGHYSAKALDAWAVRAKQWAREGKQVAIYFDNDRGGAAALDAVRLRWALDGAAAEPRAPTRRVPASRAPRSRPKPVHFGFRRRTDG